MITVTHVPSGRKKTFHAPRTAAEFVASCVSKKIKEKDLLIDNQTHVSLSIYTDRIPVWAQELIERLERDNFVGVPKWHFIDKHTKKVFSGGHTWSRMGKTSHISITRGSDDVDFAGVIIHEYAHAMTPLGEHHGRLFYRTLFRLLEDYVNETDRMKIVQREWRYMKNSRYWYAELYNNEAILAEYRKPEKVAARRLTAEEKTDQAISNLFEEM